MLFDTILGGLFVACATGLTFVAYRHPETIGRFFWAFAALFAFAAFIIRAYTYGVKSAMQIFDAPSPQLARRAIENLDLQTAALDKVYWAVGGLALIALGLDYLPKLMGGRKEHEAKGKGQTERSAEIEDDQ